MPHACPGSARSPLPLFMGAIVAPPPRPPLPLPQKHDTLRLFWVNSFRIPGSDQLDSGSWTPPRSIQDLLACITPHPAKNIFTLTVEEKQVLSSFLRFWGGTAGPHHAPPRRNIFTVTVEEKQVPPSLPPPPPPPPPIQ
jgi:hypothetical protein